METILKVTRENQQGLRVSLAREFAAELEREIGPVQMDSVVRRNRALQASGDIHCCASHDFCDANMVMHQAGVNLGLRDGWGLSCPECEDEADLCCDCQLERNLWNDAWQVAFWSDLWRTVDGK